LATRFHEEIVIKHRRNSPNSRRSNLFIAFFNFLRLIWARPEAAWSSTSKICSEVLRLHFDDSKDLVLEGLTPEEVLSLIVDGPRFEDFLRGAFIGAAEQLATETAGTFNL
jgi:hypothetical protein